MNDTAARHPNRFLADLAQAMRAAAETARQATIDQCQVDAKAYTEQLHARTEDETASLRKAAEADVSAIRDWSKAEMERLRVETEQRVSRRRELVEQELQDYDSAIELEIERVQKRVQAFQEEVAQYFEQLLQETDPTTFAGMAAQMPEPPTFADIDLGNLANDTRARREQIMGFGGMAEVENGGDAAAVENGGDAAAVENGGDAAAVENGGDAAAVENDGDAAAGDNDGDAAAGDNDGDAAAVEATAQELPEMAEEAVASRTGRRGAAAARQPAGAESTQVVVVGLVSVASIVTFKRQLSRLPGVKNVGVSSGPDGEFIFTVGHGPETSLGSLIPTLPAFQATVVSEREGVLNVSANDPEAEG